MHSGVPGSAHIPQMSAAVSNAIQQRYPDSGAARYGIALEGFQGMVASVMLRYAEQASEDEQIALVAGLHTQELVLARACAAGNELAWEEFLTRYRDSLYQTAYRIANDEATARELADGLYGDLFGIPDNNGRRRSKLDYYMGRGSLEGWLRTVLSQNFVDRYRSQRKEVSLEEQIENGTSFAAKQDAVVTTPDDGLNNAVADALAELNGEERFLLASYYLDGRTLAEIARILRVHESTISRKLDKLTGELRKRVRKRLQSRGMSPRRCDELLQELDVRDLDVDVAGKLKQETPLQAFYKKDGSTT
jgi:RNA polymerase sigma-70 factor (ECF subfamily)